MKEKKLIRFLLMTGIVCLTVIVVANVLTGRIIFSFVSEIVPYVLCQKDYRGNYVLARSTSLEFCDTIKDFSKLAKPQFCNEYSDEQKDACIKLIKIVDARKKDCLNLIFGQEKTSVNPEDVEYYCKIMNIENMDVSIPDYYNVTRIYAK